MLDNVVGRIASLVPVLWDQEYDPSWALLFDDVVRIPAGRRVLVERFATGVPPCVQGAVVAAFSRVAEAGAAITPEELFSYLDKLTRPLESTVLGNAASAFAFMRNKDINQRSAVILRLADMAVEALDDPRPSVASQALDVCLDVARGAAHWRVALPSAVARRVRASLEKLTNERYLPTREFESLAQVLDSMITA